MSDIVMLYGNAKLKAHIDPFTTLKGELPPVRTALPVSHQALAAQTSEPNPDVSGTVQGVSATVTLPGLLIVLCVFRLKYAAIKQSSSAVQ